MKQNQLLANMRRRTGTKGGYGVVTSVAGRKPIIPRQGVSRTTFGYQPSGIRAKVNPLARRVTG